MQLRCIQTTVPTGVLLALIIFSITQSNLPVTHPETATTQVSTIAMVRLSIVMIKACM